MRKHRMLVLALRCQPKIAPRVAVDFLNKLMSEEVSLIRERAASEWAFLQLGAEEAVRIAPICGWLSTVVPLPMPDWKPWAEVRALATASTAMQRHFAPRLVAALFSLHIHCQDLKEKWPLFAGASTEHLTLSQLLRHQRAPMDKLLDWLHSNLAAEVSRPELMNFDQFS